MNNEKISPLPDREDWEEFERRKRALLDAMDSGKLEPEAYEYEVRKIAEGMGL